MSDERLRELERRWKETGAAEDETAFLLERVRTGDLAAERVALAAGLGHRASEAASKSLGLDGLDPLGLILLRSPLQNPGVAYEKDPWPYEGAIAVGVGLAAVWAALEGLPTPGDLSSEDRERIETGLRSLEGWLERPEGLSLEAVSPIYEFAKETSGVAEPDSAGVADHDPRSWVLMAFNHVVSEFYMAATYEDPAFSEGWQYSADALACSLHVTQGDGVRRQARARVVPRLLGYVTR